MKLSGACKIVLTLFIIGSGSGKCGAQAILNDSLFLQTSLHSAIASYHQSMGEQSGLYNGIEYPGYPFPFKEGHPFFYDTKPNLGSISYNQVLYPGVHLQLNEVAGVVVLNEHSRKIQLINERIDSFSILDNYFIHIRKDTTNSTAPPAGFYQLLYQGNVVLLKREVKLINENIRSADEGITRSIDSRRLYYLKKGNTYFPVNNQQALFNFFGDRKKEVQAVARQRKLKFRKEKERTILELTRYYDQLIN